MVNTGDRLWTERRMIFGLLLTLAPAVAVVISVDTASGTWERVKTKPEKRTLRVTGSANKRIVSDLIVWSGDIESFAGDRTQAYKTLKAHMKLARAFLIERGIPEDEIRVSSATTRKIVDTEVMGSGVDRIERQVFRGWAAYQTVTVQSSAVDRVEKASREITSLLERGVTISSHAPTYHYTKLGEVKVDMLAEASANAHERARRIVESAGGGEVGPLWAADMGVININPANSTATSWQGNNDKTSYEKDIITIVHLTFELPAGD